MTTAIVRDIEIDPEDEVKQNAFLVLSQLPVDDFNLIKERLKLPLLGVLGPQTLDTFEKFCQDKLDLTDSGVNDFKTRMKLGNSGALQGVIGPQTAEAMFQSLMKQSEKADDTPHMNDAGLALVKEFEGLVLVAAPDMVGVLTIGYGHTGSDVVPGERITPQEADDILKKDMEASERHVTRLVTIALNSNQFSALVSLVFNIGPGALINTHLADDLANSDFPAAADDFLRFNHAGGQVVAGLTRRRQAERTLFLT